MDKTNNVWAFNISLNSNIDKVGKNLGLLKKILNIYVTSVNKLKEGLLLMKTALVTGASGGIGLEFAKLFAKQKINPVLTARNKELLKEIAGDLSKNGMQV